MKGDCKDTFCKEILGETICEPTTYLPCIVSAKGFYEAVQLFGADPYKRARLKTCYDYDKLGGEWECPSENPTTVYVDKDFTGCPQHGTKGKPVSTVTAGKEKVALGGTIIIAAGSYPESLVIDDPMTLHASGGTVVIGE